MRIYALAKQLKKESKELLDVCKTLGIAGKGNSLASLSEDEVQKITDYVTASRGSKPAVDGSADKKFEMVPPTKTTAPTNTGAVKPILTRPTKSRLASLLGGRREQPAPVAETPAPQAAPETKVEEIVAPVVAEEPKVEAPVVEEPKVEEVKVEAPVVETKVETPAPVVEEPKAEAPVEAPVEAAPEKPIERDVEVVAPVVETAKVESTPTPEEPKVAEPVVDAPKPDAAPVVEAPVEAPKAEESKAVESVAKVETVEEKTAESVQEKPVAPQAAKPAAPITEVKPAAPVAPKTPEKSAPVFSSNQNGRRPVAPLSSAMNRRDRNNDRNDRNDRRDRRDRNNDRNGNRPVENRPVRPVMPSYLNNDPQALQEMKAPPKITTLPNDSGRVRVLGGGPKKIVNLSGNNNNGSNNSGARSNNRSNVSLHLAPMPTAPQKPVAKKTQEAPAQKPVRVLTPEAFRRAKSEAGAGPLTAHMLDNAGRKGKDGDSRNNDRRNGRDSNQQGASGNRNGARVAPGRVGGAPSVGRNNVFDPSAADNNGAKNGRGGDRKRTRGDRDMEGVETARNKNGEQRRRGNNQNFNTSDDDDVRFTRVGRKREKKGAAAAAVTAPRATDIVIQMPCTVKQFSETTGVSVAAVIKELMKLGVMKTMNQPLDNEMVELLIVSLNLKATVKEEASLEEQYVDSAFDEADPPESLVPRAPVVTFLGHVDHGKTSLLDRILHLHVVAGEKGGITQHIRAYRVTTPGGAVTFVDTPGHEAFTEMRARGANCTDVAVLVVAADDGVMPQTEEAISHAKAAGVPIVVALNKMDLPGVNRDRVIQELANNDLMPSEWGGDVEVVNTSAITGMGVDELLNTLLMVAELHELKANPNRPATGVVLEASMQAGEGVVCKALVQNGTLRNGDVVLCGSAYGRVRSMTDTLDAHKRIKEAGPSVPVSLVGLDVAPEAGSKFVVLDDISVARQIAEERQKRAREIELAGAPGHVTLENLFERMNSAKQQVLNVIIRADVRGSIEAIRKELGKLEHPEVKVKILQASVGGVTEADVHLADASDAIIVGFNVVPDEGARALAETKKVQVRRYDVIYKLTEDIRAALEGMLKPIEQIKELGRALVQRTFNISHVGVIAGCRVLYGIVERNCKIRVVRDSRIIGEYQLETLKREKDDVKEVRDGLECGMKLKNFNDVKEGDVLEAYKIEEVARTL